VAYNGWIDPVSITIPAPLPGNNWYVVADTNADAESWGNFRPAGQETELGGNKYLANGRSLILMIER
jgi:isoamylase